MFADGMSSPQSEVVILIGLQGSGKTTFFRQRYEDSHIHLSKDLFRSNSRPQRRQLFLLREALSASRNIVVDNTNATSVERSALIAAAGEFNARVTGFYFRSVVSECLENNSRRAGKARVPNVALFATFKRLQLPSLQEGFDTLYYVRWSSNGEYHIQEWDSQWREGSSALLPPWG